MLSRHGRQHHTHMSPGSSSVVRWEVEVDVVPSFSSFFPVLAKLAALRWAPLRAAHTFVEMCSVVHVLFCLFPCYAMLYVRCMLCLSGVVLHSARLRYLHFNKTKMKKERIRPNDNVSRTL